jgi:hypothetical protein
MTTRVQVQRPTATGVRPTGRRPGEFYVNFADMQFGVINTSGTAQDLGAVRFFSTTANYATGAFVIQAGVLYFAKSAITAGAFNASQWTAVGGSGVGFLPLSGGTLTGPLAGVDATFSNFVTAYGYQIGNASTNSILQESMLTLQGASNTEVFIRAINSVDSGNRWVIDLMDGTAESGGNNGNDLKFTAWSNTGSLLSTPIKIKRSSGVVTFSQPIVNGPSDKTLKENITPIEDALEKVNALEGVNFNMIATPDQPEIGLIAQDVARVVPEVLQEFDHDGAIKLSVDYPRLVALLIEAIKTLTERVAALETA